jgi:hypothetical protein
MTDLSRIDFSKCELPEWKRLSLQAVYQQGSLRIRDNTGRLVAVSENGDWVLLLYGICPTFRELDELRELIKLVDAFIVTELAKPQRRKITGEQAAIALLQGKKVWRGDVGTVAQPDHRGERSIPGDVLSWSNAEIYTHDVVSGVDGGVFDPSATFAISSNNGIYCALDEHFWLGYRK